ncbi:ribosome maturation factor RimP [Clostridium sp. CAG:1193]|nr:ribosome maturation factor RimP [Clostridium sp. CAG:1193]
MSIEEKVKNAIESEINNLGILLKEVKYEQEKGVYYLRIFIDKEPFITIDDCVLVTNTINPILDKIDIIDNSYMLDVSSIEKGGNYE